MTSWIQLKKIRFLQDRNPGVPGIIYKLNSDTELVRKLSNARELWKSFMTISPVPICDIYSGLVLDVSKYDLDHFVPWSFIANDELWNLIPMERRLNSSKSNNLPRWDLYFEKMAYQQYSLYKCIFENNVVRSKFENCRRDNLNAVWATEKLYIAGNSKDQFISILEKNLKPLYDSAHLQGYEFWKIPNELYQGQ